MNKAPKMVRRLDSITTYRSKPPQSPEIVERGMTNMRPDYSTQRAVVPTCDGGTRTTNTGGRPKALPTRRG